MQAAVISKKHQLSGVNLEIVSYIYIHSIFTLLLIKQTFEKNKSSRAGSKSWVQFLSRMIPDYKKPLREIENESNIILEISVKLDSS